MTTIKCPNCGRQVEITQAFREELEEEILNEERRRFERELAKEKEETKRKVIRKLEEQFAIQLKNYQEEIEETKKRNRELLTQLSETNRLIRDLKRRDEERKYEMEKQFLEKEEKIRLEAKEKAEEEQRLKLLEKEKQLQDALKVNQQLKQKLEQGSPQNQGEVLEQQIEEVLSREFPNDKITPVAKGIRGADVIQEIWDRKGNRCGVILWELKNAKWNEGWIEKLKSDQRNIKAEIAVLLSENLPEEVHTAAYKEGVWISHPKFTVGIAMALRANVIQAFHIRKSVEGKNEKMEILFQYLSGVEFRQRIEAIIEAFTHLQEELEREKRWFAAKWARQEKQIRYVIDHTHGMHGDLKGIIGAALPEIKSLTSPSK